MAWREGVIGGEVLLVGPAKLGTWGSSGGEERGFLGEGFGRDGGVSSRIDPSRARAYEALGREGGPEIEHSASLRKGDHTLRDGNSPGRTSSGASLKPCSHFFRPLTKETLQLFLLPSFLFWLVSRREEEESEGDRGQ